MTGQGIYRMKHLTQLSRLSQIIVLLAFSVALISCIEWSSSSSWPSLPAPSSLHVIAVSSGRVSLGWAYDGAPQYTTGFYIYRDGVHIASTGDSLYSSFVYSDTTVYGNTTYCYQVSAHNPSHESARSNTICATTPPDTEAPTAPGQLTAVVSSINEVTLAWSQATDNVAVAGYKIYRDDQYLKTVTEVTATDSVLSNAIHCYRITAIDDVGNESLSSNTACIDNSWRTETLVNASDVHNLSLALDSANHVHITYYDITYGELIYLTNASGSWVSTTLDYMGTGEYPASSIAIDANDKVHISYKDTINGYLKYANNTSGTWTSEVLDASGNTGSYNSIAIDSLGHVHISYYRYGLLSYITNKTGSWVSETVDAGIANLLSSIAVDSSNNVSISYQHNYYPEKEVKFATNKTGAWVNEIIDATVASDSSLTIDTADNSHICYTNGGIEYATNATGTWQYYSGDDFLRAQQCSISTDAANNPHISYRSEDVGWNLMYTTYQSGEWRTFTIDSGMTGSQSVIKVDSNNKAHIVYLELLTYNLVYATNSL